MKKIISALIGFIMVFLMCAPFAYAGDMSNEIDCGLAVPQFTTVTRKGKGNTTLNWEKSKDADGYQIEYSTSDTFDNAKTVNIKNGKTTKKVLKNLPKTKSSYLRIRAFSLSDKEKQYSDWSAAVKIIMWDSSLKYAKYSKIHSDPAVLYYSPASKNKNITVAVNAGHGCKGGSAKKTLCHPDGTAKVTGGSTKAGAKYATSINEGTSLKGMSEAAANLKIAKKVKENLLSRGYNVLMLRQDGNTQLDNIARTVIANNHASCHISIHFDSTNNNKGAFFIGVPKVKSLRNMEPVKSHWKQHDKLGKAMIGGLKKSGVKIWNTGNMPLDLTQTSYSTIPSVDIEVGDRGTNVSDKNLSKIAKGLTKGIQAFYKN